MPQPDNSVLADKRLTTNSSANGVFAVFVASVLAILWASDMIWRDAQLTGHADIVSGTVTNVLVARNGRAPRSKVSYSYSVHGETLSGYDWIEGDQSRSSTGTPIQISYASGHPDICRATGVSTDDTFSWFVIGTGVFVIAADIRVLAGMRRRK